MTADDVTAIIVTRGDVDLTPVLDSLIFEQRVVWDNSVSEDNGAFGRYLAIWQTTTDCVFFQDDDCIIPAKDQQRLVDSYNPELLTALMPRNRDDYRDTILVGWGSLCLKYLPWIAFSKWQEAGYSTVTREFLVVGADFVFPMLTPWKRLDGEHTDLPHAHAPNRTWGSWPNYEQVKNKYLNAARALRDGKPLERV